ncbi:MAG TPA: HAD family phosphatase [Vicinamibacterales bacterium]|nr:HAD family phosphatase [Vicinamibacterales bacterium]
MVCPPPQPSRRAPQGIVFDFDGVLVNSEPLHLRATQEALALRGLDMSEEEYYQRYVGFDDVTMFVELARDRGEIWCSDDLQELVAAKALRFEALERSVTPLVAGAAACVRRMADLAPIAIASGARREEIERMLGRAGLRPLFSAIVAAGDTPSGKPAPDPYAEAAARLRAQPARTIAIEDTAAGLASAKAAGLRCIGITTTFRADKLQLADVIVGSLDEVTAELVSSLV